MDPSLNIETKPYFILWRQNYQNGFRKYINYYTESGHGKGAPGGVGAACKITADAVVSFGGDIDNLGKFEEAIQQRCPAITLSIVHHDEIKQMSAEIEREVTKVKQFVGTLKVHQVAGKFYNPLGVKSSSIEIVMKHLSCFCDNDCSLHFSIGKILYEDKPKPITEDLLTSSESENEPGPSPTTVKAFNNGDFILLLIKLLANNMEYRYVGIIDKIDEDGEIRTFLKLYDNKGLTFTFNQNAVADVTMDQVIEKLPNPNILLKRNRVFYKFNSPVNVFEKR